MTLLTIELLKDSFDCSRAAAARHGDVELVLVFRHGVATSQEFGTRIRWRDARRMDRSGGKVGVDLDDFRVESDRCECRL